MSCIFDIDEPYRESRAKEYTRKHLIEVLELSRDEKCASGSAYEYRTAVNNCEKLCPMTLGKKDPSEEEGLSGGNWHFTMGQKERTEVLKTLEVLIDECKQDESLLKDLKDKELQRLNSLIKEVKGEPEEYTYFQFLYYMIMNDRKYKKKYNKKHFSVFNCIEHPSQRYCDVYTDMVREIWGKVSELARVAVNGSHADRSGSTPPDKSQYAHTLQRLCDMISNTFMYAYNYSNDTLETLEDRERSFHKSMNRLAMPNYPSIPIRSCWDELFFRLCYAQCLYLERDLLWAYSEAQKAALKLPKDSRFLYMRKEEFRMITPEDNCFLVLNDKTGQIEEMPELLTQMVDTGYNIDKYTRALTRYIKSHAPEIAKKTFCKQNVTPSEEKSILDQIPDICEYLKIELHRYGHNKPMSKAKLISAYQANFLTLPRSGIAPKLKGIVEVQADRGLIRGKNAPSSAYIDYSNKEPLFLQWICTWTDYQFIWNMQGSLFAKKYLETNVLVLKAILRDDQSLIPVADGFQFSVPDIQLHAEQVLWTTMETLIPDAYGREQLLTCTKRLSKPGRQVVADDQRLLITFGKFCKVFDLDKIITKIDAALNAVEEPKLIYQVFLNSVTDNALRMYSPELWISYNRDTNIYMLRNFYAHNLVAFFQINSM